MSDDEDKKLFEEALASMAPADVFRGKYGAPQPAEDAVASSAEADAVSREELQRLRELRDMERAFAGVERFDGSKYHVPPPKDELGSAEADELREQFEAAMRPEPRPDAPKPPPPKSLAEQAPSDVHTLNLRGFEVDDALSQLGLFVDLASKDGHSFIRLRVGSNLELLEALKRWLKGPGLTYIDEVEITQPHADAAIFARIRRNFLS